MRVGARIIEVCEILEELGPVGSGDVAEAMALRGDGKKVGNSNAGKYCARAVDMGLLTVDKSPIGNSSHYAIFAVQPDWRSRIKGKSAYVKQAKPYARPAPKKSMFSFVISIFQVGA